MSNKIYFDNKVSYDWIRYKDGYWIPHRKRVYLYWFKYLQQAELSPRHTVDWTQYDGWGGANAVLGMKFDDEVESYVSSNFQCLNPEITLMSMRISYKVIGDTNHPV